MTLRVLSTIGSASTLEVNDSVFKAKLNPTLIAQAVRVYLSNQRQATSKTKTRSEVARTKQKWFKQKGTGNARHGARTPSIFVGGGVAHGPTGTQNYTLQLSGSMRRSALASVLSAQAEHIVVSEDILKLDGKTASAAKLFSKMLPEAKHILLVVDEVTPLLLRSVRNIEKVYLTTASRLTTYEVAYADDIVCTKAAIKILEISIEKKESTRTQAEPVEAEVKAPKVAKAKPAAATKKPAAKKATK